ncbi:hypothetical protein T03_14404 [Trichinella britovi]|uniref:Uncharacterized protein n=1 Tax=Trichinella britovi TaxID=45882 RepID=A0A0V1C9V9_TRIBR|nr:hypothetical protein T03_14404 [Trichinella britovi]
MRRLRALRQQLNRDPEKDQEYLVTTLTVDRQKKWMEHQVRQKELGTCPIMPSTNTIKVR